MPADNEHEPAFVEVSSASLNYGLDEGSLALKDASLSISKREFVAVVGSSGCGKSTLLKLISGLRRPTTGHVRVAGEELTAPSKTVGMAFQNPILLPWRTTLENVLLPLEIVQPYRHRMRSKEAYSGYVESARALLAKVGLRNVDAKFPWELSGGMQQRVSLCRALIHNPEILLLDEPFGALDAFTREELWDVLQVLWSEEDFTVLLVTHDLAEATYLADTVFVMSNRPGRVVFRMKVNLPRPRTGEMRYTAEFIEHVHKLRAQIGHARDGS